MPNPMGRIKKGKSSIIAKLSSHQDSLHLDTMSPERKGMDANLAVERTLEQLFNEVR